VFLLSKTLSYQFEVRSGVVRKEFWRGGGGEAFRGGDVWAFKQGGESAYFLKF